MARYLKDPNAKLDYQIDWSTWLDGDTISASSWTVPDGVVNDDDSNSDTAATIWLTGGTAGTEYEVVNRIVTAGGRQDERTITIVCEDR